MDPYRLTHMKNKHFATFPDHTGLQHQLCRFGNSHEITLHALIGDCYGTAVANLFAKDRNYRPGGTDHVAKAHSNKTSLELRIQILDYELSGAFGGAHNRGRPHRLIGRD